MPDFEALVWKRSWSGKQAGDIIDVKPAGFNWGDIGHAFLIVPIAGISKDTAIKLKHPEYEDGEDVAPTPDTATGVKRKLVSKRKYRIPIDDPTFKSQFPAVNFDKLGGTDQPFKDQSIKLDPVKDNVIKDKATDTYKKFTALAIS